MLVYVSRTEKLAVTRSLDDRRKVKVTCAALGSVTQCLCTCLICRTELEHRWITGNRLIDRLQDR